MFFFILYSFIQITKLPNHQSQINAKVIMAKRRHLTGSFSNTSIYSNVEKFGKLSIDDSTLDSTLDKDHIFWTLFPQPQAIVGPPALPLITSRKSLVRKVTQPTEPTQPTQPSNRKVTNPKQHKSAKEYRPTKDETFHLFRVVCESGIAYCVDVTTNTIFLPHPSPIIRSVGTYTPTTSTLHFENWYCKWETAATVVEYMQIMTPQQIISSCMHCAGTGKWDQTYGADKTISSSVPCWHCSWGY